MKNFSDSVKYIGADDKDLDLFESQYIVPNGVSYNSYVIIDDKIAVMDTIDERKTDEWFANLEKELGGKTPDYLVISHLEPDHSANIKKFTEKYPSAALVGTAKTFAMLPQFFDIDASVEKITVKEGDCLSLGSHELTFIMAPMVHWPEVMLEYEKTEKILFSADAFGKFGALDTDGLAKQGVIISTLWENTADLFRLCLKKRQILRLKQSARFTAPFLQKILNIT